jgi:very-short-patch-repair endonuclease
VCAPLAGRDRIDVAYPEARLAIELDGWDTHRSRSAFQADRAKGNDLVLIGWRLLRFTSTSTDAEIVAAVRAALAASGRPMAG